MELQNKQDAISEFQRIGNVKRNAQTSWSFTLQIVVLLVMIGYTWASFQTKAEAKMEAEYNAKTYMSKELSEDRWKQNEYYQRRTERKLDALMLKFNVRVPDETEDEAKVRENRK